YSLSARLLLLFIISGVLMMGVFQYFIGSSFKQHFEDEIRPHLQHYIQNLHREIGSPPNLERAKDLSERLLVDIIIDGENLHWSSTGVFPELSKFHFQSVNNRPDMTVQRGFYHGQFLLRIKKHKYTTIFITRGSLDHLAFGRLIVLSVFLFVLVLVLLYFAIRWLFQPLKVIQADMQRIGAGEFQHRVSTARRDEFGELASSLNQMADDIEQMLEAKGQLLLAISHELRSPITRAKVALSLMEESALKAGLAEDLQEMEQLIYELLEAERLNGRHQALNLAEQSLNDVVGEVIEFYFPAAGIKHELDKNLLAFQFDEMRLKLVLKNLLDNALKHQQPNSAAIEVETFVAGERVILKVTDYGEGIAAEHLPHLTEPFYRADPSRQRKTGGYGLGLYLIRLIVEAHGGELQIKSELGVGSSVVVCLPITNAPFI
ncbi:MAG: HAMP domain-containing sensor histidine kinase, partial [Gammaproteobacteria bacterium]|nr:HAMP domain-containing sensor histidine kinase [Gammaproteobacteria bacterium]